MYTLEDKEYQFKKVSVQDALEIKKAITLLAKDNATSAQIGEAENILNSICVKHLQVKINGELENVESLDYLSVVFDNPFAIVEITANFQELVTGFIQSLPKFQSAGKTLRKK